MTEKIDKIKITGTGKHWVEILYYGKKYLVFAINKRDKLRVVRWKNKK
jgi:hypothetical protein